MNAKTIGGCFFGCLAFVFFLVLAVGLSQIYGVGPTLIADADAPSYLSVVGGTCCCLSSVMFVVLLALGMKKDQPESYE